jgi:rhodanese-related sulfurtransferase
MTESVLEIDPMKLKEMLDHEDILLIDVREKMEYAPEHITGAYPIPTSVFDSGRVPEAEGRRVVFYCQGGVRSYNSARRWVDEQEKEDAVAYSLAGGIASWKKEGFSTHLNSLASENVQQQINMIVGTLVILMTILTVVVNSWFALGTGFIGAGLIVSGITGLCSLKFILAKMPWNS